MLRHPATEISAMVNFVKSHGYEQTLKDSDRLTGRIDDSREQPEHTVPYQSYQSVTSRSFHHVVLMFDVFFTRKIQAGEWHHCSYDLLGTRPWA